MARSTPKKKNKKAPFLGVADLRTSALNGSTARVRSTYEEPRCTADSANDLRLLIKLGSGTDGNSS